ncbi:hypothetical protein JVT61DRAFT_13295 [Boletus reticuloceps]|uniref:Uncharacterized protein n=1 Tax=Boletus reticuloceps TaxID=495285 RepID=A0A8I2YVU6_9AGAM|nr:hypothetical protein JVT61DRAFT_13295 [Boletus reticuloceps]
MASYVQLIRKDVFRQESCDASSWPSHVSEFVRSLQNEMKIPSWFKQGPGDCANRSLDRFCTSDDPYNVDLWDSMDKIIDKETEQRLRSVFNTALVDCARIQAVVKAEDLTGTPFPKESFLVILVRNAVSEAHTGLFSLEDVPVVLPRHFSGETIPILKYMTKRFYAPLVISIIQELPVEQKESDVGHQLSDEEESTTGSSESKLVVHSPPTLSEWLDACERPKTPEEDEEEDEEEGFLSPQFEAHFIAYPPSATIPSLCHIPVLCMADEEQLPVLMSSLLYQRAVWHVTDPLVGLEFSKYDTTIRLFAGWLEEDVSPNSALPRVHIGEIRTPLKLDLSLPSVALVVSQLLYSLESHIRHVRDSARHSVGAVISHTQSHPSISWRIDTDYFQKEGSASVPENNNTRNTIIHWIKSQQYPIPEDSTMPSHKSKRGTSLSGSTTSSATPQRSTSSLLFPPPASSLASEATHLSLEIREPEPDVLMSSDAARQKSRLSFSAFADTTEDTDDRVFRWMFDRRVVPQSLPTDSDFRQEYCDMTGFIWPDTWSSREDLPSVDAAVEPCIQELLESVAVLKTRPGAVKSIPVNEFPFDLGTLERSFSAIFQASHRCREKTKQGQGMLSEAAWRHDHDRLLFDFFIRLIQPTTGDATHTLIDGHSIVPLEDPLSRPILETTLRLPKSDNSEVGDQVKLGPGIQMLVMRQANDLVTWLQDHGRPPNAYSAEFQHSAFVIGHFSSWALETEETEEKKISYLTGLPSIGRCDALGRLLVELPNVSPGAVHRFPLVVRRARDFKPQASKGATESRASSRKSRPPSSMSEGNSSLKVPVRSSGKKTEKSGARYTLPSSSVSTSMNLFDKGQRSSPESVDLLVREVQHLQVGTNAPYLELPILTAEYKKASAGLMKGTNQVRMYLTASVKFLQAIGITDFAVYGVQTDGPITVIPAAILRGKDNSICLFERLVEKIDISTPVGAWHYATILCRLAQNHAKKLEEKFEKVRDNLVKSLQNGDEVESWTLEHQWEKLGVNKVN